MYNQEIKERFLDEVVKPASRIESERRFNVLAIQESLYAKDISEMSVQESKQALNAIEFTEASSLDSYLSTFRKYVEWCKNNEQFASFDGGFLELSSDDIDPSYYISSLFFRDENDLIYSLRKVRDFSEGRIEVVCIALLWLGFKIPDLLKIKDADFDLDARKIYGENGEVVIDGFSDQLYDIFYQYIHCNSITRDNGKLFIKDFSFDFFVKRFDHAQSKYIGVPLSQSQVVTRIAKMNNEYSGIGYRKRFTPEIILKSGYLSKLLELEKGGVDIESSSADDLIMAVYKNSTPYRIRWQYKYYKKAFNL